MDWNGLRNPILSYPDWSVKDAAVIRHADEWLLFFSAFHEDRGRVRSHVVGVSSRDLRTFSEPFLHWDGGEEGWIGLCSPDISRHNDAYYMTFNSWGDKNDRPNQLFMSTSSDGRTWSSAVPLARSLTEGKRAIDAALRFTERGVYLLYKEVQTTRLAVALEPGGTFTFVGDGLPTLETSDGKPAACENYQFVTMQDGVRLLATRMDHGHLPYLFEPTADPLRWCKGCELSVPRESFIRLDKTNAAYLLDCRAEDGFLYLLYAGNTEKRTFLGRGHNRIAMARSSDGKVWQIPGSD